MSKISFGGNFHPEHRTVAWLAILYISILNGHMLLHCSMHCLFCGMSDVNSVVCVCMGTGLDQSS